MTRRQHKGKEVEWDNIKRTVITRSSETWVLGAGSCYFDCQGPLDLSFCEKFLCLYDCSLFPLDWVVCLCHVYCNAIVSVYLVYRSFVFHQPCFEGSSCLPYVEGATFTWNTVDNTLHVMFVWLSFDHHQSNGNRLSLSTSFPLCCLLVILLLPVLLSV